MIRRCLGALCLIVLAIPLVYIVCAMLGFLQGSSAGGTLATGRSVMTYSDSFYLSSTLHDDTATIKTAFKTIVVEPAGLFVDGSNVATIDPKVSKVEVRVTRGNIRFLADGKIVTPTTR